MNQSTAPDAGRANRLFGWTLLTLALLASGGIDAYAAAEPAIMRVMVVRHTQAVVFGMAFFQLLLGRLLSRVEVSAPRASVLSLVGSTLYVVGYLLWVVWPNAVFIAALGAALNFAAVLMLTRRRFPPALGVAPYVATFVLCGGMILDAAMAAASSGVALPLPLWADDVESLPLRMLRLARAAMIALPLLAVNYAEARERTRPLPRPLEWAGAAASFGAATMSLILVLSACVWTSFKYLLFLPADAAVIGVVAGAWLTFRRVEPFGLAGWLFVLAGMTAGLFMGLYAFDGPLPSPAFLGEYNEFARRVSRLTHASAVIYGLTLINLQHHLPAREPPWARLLLVCSAAVALLHGTLVALGATESSPAFWLLSSLVGVGLGACLPSLFARLESRI